MPAATSLHLKNAVTDLKPSVDKQNPPQAATASNNIENERRKRKADSGEGGSPQHKKLVSGTSPVDVGLSSSGKGKSYSLTELGNLSKDDLVLYAFVLQKQLEAQSKASSTIEAPSTLGLSTGRTPTTSMVPESAAPTTLDLARAIACLHQQTQLEIRRTRQTGARNKRPYWRILIVTSTSAIVHTFWANAGGWGIDSDDTRTFAPRDFEVGSVTVWNCIG
ncbi:MAG: hypothetical protein Q9174_006655 [Haloplaca sp. 1 TL-2023]